VLHWIIRSWYTGRWWVLHCYTSCAFLWRIFLLCRAFSTIRFESFCINIHCVPKKHVTTFLMISWSRTVRLERFLAHLLLRVQVFLFSHLAYFVQLLYLGKLSRPKHQQKLNKIMKILQEDVILIKNLYLSKQCGARRLLRELPNKGWKLWSINSLLKRIHKTGTIVPLPGSVRLRLSHSSEKPCAQSGGQAKKPSVSSLDFAWNCHSLFECIQKNNSPWSPAHMLQMMSCSAVVWSQLLSPVSLTDKQRYRLQ